MQSIMILSLAIVSSTPSVRLFLVVIRERDKSRQRIRIIVQFATPAATVVPLEDLKEQECISMSARNTSSERSGQWVERIHECEGKPNMDICHLAYAHHHGT